VHNQQLAGSLKGFALKDIAICLHEVEQWSDHSPAGGEIRQLHADNLLKPMPAAEAPFLKGKNYGVNECPNGKPKFLYSFEGILIPCVIGHLYMHMGQVGASALRPSLSSSSQSEMRG
jgi:hypothetical protein